MFGIFGQKVLDPVCKMGIDPKESKHYLEHKGKKYYFCSESCQKKFGDGDKYVATQRANVSGCCCH